MFFRETDSDKADELLSQMDTGELRVVIPSFAAIEFVNVLWLKVRHDRAMRPGCEAALKRFLALADQMDVVPAEPLLNEVLANSIQYDHSAYDVAFLVLAATLGIPLVTADAKLYRRVSPRFPSAVLLSDLEMA